MKQSRRYVLKTLVVMPPVILSACPARYAWGQAAELAPTPTCPGSTTRTPHQATGPFYRSDAPRRTDLTADASAQPLFSLHGFVLDTRCRAIPDAMVEIWHADEHGEYDNSGYRWRAHQFTDASGRWGFDTIMTEHYSFRTAHYHFRVERPGGEVLITQLYVPDYPRNGGDPLFDPRLVMSMSADERSGKFDFVLPAG